MKPTYECSDLIAEAKEDLEEFGSEEIVAVWFKTISGYKYAINYDFMTKEKPIGTSELEEGEELTFLSLKALIEILEDQNKILG